MTKYDAYNIGYDSSHNLHQVETESNEQKVTNRIPWDYSINAEDFWKDFERGVQHGIETETESELPDYE